MTWEAQIRDVCANCNNNHLSKLDSYSSDFFKKNRIGKRVTNKKMANITYDYSLLSRVLLKMTYNVLRFKGEDTGWIENFRQYILCGIGFPVQFRIQIAAEIVPCHKITKKGKNDLADRISK